MEELQLLKLNCSSFIEMIQNQKQYLDLNQEWKEQFHLLLKKHAKHMDNEKKLKKVSKKLASLYSQIKEGTKSQRKRERKQRLKEEQKHVHFAKQPDIHSFVDGRSWNDHKDNPNIIKGKFQEGEVQKLLHALCSCVKEQGLGEEELVDLVSKSKEEMSEELRGAWCKIAEALPNRSVQSCHNLCKRRFNPDNYSGKWSHEEEQLLKKMVEQEGRRWKVIAERLNSMQKFGGEDEIKPRTALNVKDKWKQLGSENHQFRKKGPWSLQEGLQLLDAVQIACGIQLLSKSKKIIFENKPANGGTQHKRVIQVGDEVLIHDKNIHLREVLPLLMKKNRCKRQVPKLRISWTEVASHLQDRSYDDIRNYWNFVVLPILLPPPRNSWTQNQDLELLQQVVGQEEEEEAELDFEGLVVEGKSAEECQDRWVTLRKGIGGVTAGRKFKVRALAEKMFEEISTEQERYVGTIATAAPLRDGSQQHMDILQYFRDHYQ